MAAMTAGIIERYADYYPVTAATPRVTLGEGSTPLVRSSRIGPSIGVETLYFKYEGLNPSGSFKDRGMALATAMALEAGAQTLLCASTGNTSASASAYAARCGLRAAVVVPAGGIAAGRVARPRTVASAIRIGNPASWAGAIAARDESGGTIEAVSDAEITAAHRRLAREEGLLVEPASAAGVALLLRKAKARQLADHGAVVWVLTGHGLKDPQALTRGLKMPRPVEPTLAAVRRAIG